MLKKKRWKRSYKEKCHKSGGKGKKKRYSFKMEEDFRDRLGGTPNEGPQSIGKGVLLWRRASITQGPTNLQSKPQKLRRVYKRAF